MTDGDRGRFRGICGRRIGASKVGRIGESVLPSENYGVMIYRARPDVRVVMHTHPRWSTLLTIAGVAYSRCTHKASCSAAYRSLMSTHSEPSGAKSRTAAASHDSAQAR